MEILSQDNKLIEKKKICKNLMSNFQKWEMKGVTGFSYTRYLVFYTMIWYAFL